MTPEELYEKNEKIVYGVMHRYFPDLAFDEDMLQEAKLALWVACLAYDPARGKLSTLAYPSIRNHINCLLRNARAEKRAAETLSLTEPLCDEADAGTLEEILPGEEDVGWLDWEEVQRRLRPRDKEIMRLHYAGFNQREIADRLGCSQVLISRRLKYIRKTMEEHL